MANPNPQLEAALAQFAAQPGTTPDQEAQLHAAVIADTDRLDLLNRQAAAGQLKGFALETPGSTTPTLSGTYDKAAGIITVPTASFQSNGSAAGNDLKAVVGLQAITVDFAHKTWQDPAGQTHTVNQDMVSNLQGTLNGSPILAAQIKDAVMQGHVQHFSLLGNSMAAGATYDGNTVQQDGTPKGINLPPLGLQTNSPANPQGRYDAKDMTFVLGHEMQHGFNDAAKDQATRSFMRNINTQAQAQGPVHDYTNELRAYIQAGREDEAKAEIAGWNALLSREQQLTPTKPGLDLMADARNGRTLAFVQRDQITNVININPGLTFNPDGSLSQTPANIAAMGQHYFDRPSSVHALPNQRPVHLGEHKPNPTADYINYYGTWALEKIVAAEDQANVQYQGAKPQIAINMAGLGLKEDLIEMEGLDLGTNKAPRPYLDTSQTPAAPGHFHHTQDASTGHDHQHVPITSDKAPTPQTVTPPIPEHLQDFRHPEHPQHSRYQGVLKEAHRMEEARGIPAGPHSEQMAAAWVERLGKEDKHFDLDRFEMRGSEVIAYARRDNYFEPERAVSLNADQALSRPVEQVSADWAKRTMPHLGLPQPMAQASLADQDFRLADPARQAQHERLREQVADTYAKAGILRSDAQLDSVTAAVTLDMQKHGLNRADHLYLQTNRDGAIGPDSGIGAVQGRYPLQLYSQTSPEAMQQAPDDSYRQLAQVAQQQMQEQQQRQTAAQQQGPMLG